MRHVRKPQNDSCHETAGKIVFSQAKGLKKGLVTENKITTTNHTWGWPHNKCWGNLVQYMYLNQRKRMWFSAKIKLLGLKIGYPWLPPWFPHGLSLFSTIKIVKFGGSDILGQTHESTPCYLDCCNFIQFWGVKAMYIVLYCWFSSSRI